MKDFSSCLIYFSKGGCFFLISVFIFFSCTEEFENPGTEETLWVYSYPSFFKPELSLIVSEDEELNYILENWKKIPFTIQGFTHKQNYFQKIKVLKTENSETGEVTRKLIEILDEKEDYFYLINGNWELINYLGKSIPNNEFQFRPGFSFSPTFRMAVSPLTCGNATFRINEVKFDQVSFDVLSIYIFAKVCFEHEKAPPPFAGMGPGSKFRVEGDKLYFYNESYGEIAIWQRIE